MLFDGLANALATLDRRAVVVAFDGAHRLGKSTVLDGLTKPRRVVAVLQMEQPRVVVDAFGELQELDEIARAQIQLLLRPAEIEAAIGRQLAFGVLARVSPPLRATRRDLQVHGRLCSYVP